MMNLFPISSEQLQGLLVAATEKLSFFTQLNQAFSDFVAALKIIFFYPIFGFPIIVLWLIIGGVYFTFRMGLINIKGFSHALAVLSGKYQSGSDDDDQEGEVSPFQAASTALSATVGLGSIAGSAIAIQMGGPGAIVWMSIAGFLGMSSKFVECTLGQKYRQVKPDGSVAGGPMYYISGGLAELGFRPLGSVLGVLFAILCVLGTFGAGNMFQANQSYAALAGVLPFIADRSWFYGLIMALLVGVVIIGGISRIGVVTSRLVPIVVLFYMTGCLWIILSNWEVIPEAVAIIFKGAFSPTAIEGGIVGVIVQGFRRAAFSNGAGIGSAAIAHSATRNDEPVREGIVASIEPLVDTLIICNLTAISIVITGVYKGFAVGEASGIQLTAAAFGTVVSWFPTVLAIAVILFAFSNIVSWSYYGEQAWMYLFGEASTLLYKVIFIVFVFLGSVIELGVVLDFSDMMLIAMSVPNLLGCFLLAGKVGDDLQVYMEKLRLERAMAANTETDTATKEEEYTKK
ncbi:alanine/glycine:cation symporter family protein [Dactylococcopsis salina]|uniref:Amino acid carrier protein n=1 Tax=Dactylococcopsis salina (strain PCC 8305) TaxID=13035 RepID=K9YVV5_DACS8|nr:alanine/glycine:cation symporter family protein [Dactylococcopsis salina]AFZ50480.1 amino acid carrier protein [Dactylococcopsis salina PCC 8305]